MSEAGRIAGVYFEPQKAFADIAARPRWIAPIALMIVAGMALTFLFGAHIGWENFMRKTLENNAQVQQMDPQKREEAIQRGVKFAPIFGYAGSALMPVINALAIAGAVLLMGKMMGVSSLNFKQMFAIGAYGLLPGFIFAVLTIVVMMLKNPDDFNLQNPLFFNIGAFFEPPPNTGKFLYSLASSFDLFSFWTIALLATGITAAERKFPFSKALAAVVIPWIVWVLARSAWAGIFG